MEKGKLSQNSQFPGVLPDAAVGRIQKQTHIKVRLGKLRACMWVWIVVMTSFKKSLMNSTGEFY
jgi:hypothetical protein